MDDTHPDKNCVLSYDIANAFTQSLCSLNVTIFLKSLYNFIVLSKEQLKKLLQSFSP